MENKNNKTFKIVISLVAFLSLVLSFTALIITIKNSKNSEVVSDYATKYTLYVGTNDKDTYKQEIETDKCIEKVTATCVKYSGGCTISEARGYWTDEASNITIEYTIVVILEDIEEETVYKICDELIVELNQNSILVETSDVKTNFYSRTK